MRLFAIPISIAALLATPASAGWQEDTIAKQQGETKSIQILSELLGRNGAQCSDPLVATANGYLDSQADRLATATDMAYSRQSGAGTSYIGKKILAAILTDVVENRFTLADAALHANCLDEADKIYRGTLTIFVGSKFEAARQRAMIGIDDVRAARAAV